MKILLVSMMLIAMALAGCSNTPEPGAPGGTELGAFSATYAHEGEDRVHSLSISIEGKETVRDRLGRFVESWPLHVQGSGFNHVVHLDAGLRVVRSTMVCGIVNDDTCRHQSVDWESAGAPAPFGIGLLDQIDEGRLAYELMGGTVVADVSVERAGENTLVEVASPFPEVAPNFLSPEGSYRYGEIGQVPDRIELQGLSGSRLEFLLQRFEAQGVLPALEAGPQGKPLFVPSRPDASTPPGAETSPTRDGVTLGQAYQELLNRSENASRLAKGGACIGAFRISDDANPMFGGTLAETKAGAYEFSFVEGTTATQFQLYRETTAGVHQWHVVSERTRDWPAGCGPRGETGLPQVPLDGFVSYVRGLSVRSPDEIPAVMYGHYQRYQLDPEVSAWHRWEATWFPDDPAQAWGDFNYGIVVDAVRGGLLGYTAHPEDLARWDDPGDR